MIIEVIRLEDKLKTYEGTNKNTKESEKLAMAGNSGEIGKLRKDLETRTQDLETLKKQSAQLHKEYDALSDKYAATQMEGGVKKEN